MNDNGPASDLFQNYKNKPTPTPTIGSVFWSLLWAMSVVILVFNLSFIYGAFSYGYVVMSFWQWFIVPVFHLEPLSLLQATGVMYMIQLLTIKYNPLIHIDGKNKPTLKETFQYYFMLVVFPWLYLMCGYLLHRLIIY
jgi:hypothetical protein